MRRSANISLKQNKIEYFVPNSCSQKKVSDVIVVGGGISGVTTVLLLQRNGMNCLEAEA